MNNINDKQYYILLIDFYDKLLTNKQLTILKYYYEEDYSLSEIATINNTSKSSIYDIINRSKILLNKYEDKLKLVYKYQQRQILYNKILTINNKKINSLIYKCIDIE